MVNQLDNQLNGLYLIINEKDFDREIHYLKNQNKIFFIGLIKQDNQLTQKKK